MPLFRAQIEFQWGADTFSNDFLMITPTINDAEGYADQLADLISNMQLSVVEQHRILTSPVPDPTRTNFIEQARLTLGTRGLGGQEMASGSQCVRIFLNTATGLPGSKYIRGALLNNETKSTGETTTFIGGSGAYNSSTATANGINSFITAHPGVLVVGKTHRTVVGAQLDDNIYTRKMDNKWHNRRRRVGP